MTRKDLTRWNRAGLGHVQYVDGNAAVWLDELRVGMLVQFLRNLDVPPDHADARTANFWRDLFAGSDTLRTHAKEFAASLAWPELLPPIPADPETISRRNARLVEAYRAKSPDYAREIMRAVARAAHILLGHVDAYANEGYLRTATQWDNARRLASMVNYQPTPPASAATAIALILAPEAGAVEIEPGIAMRHTPADGGKAAVFETGARLHAHPALNAARARDWNRNRTRLDPTGRIDWLAPKEFRASPGDLVAVDHVDGRTGAPLGAQIVEARLDAKAGLARLTLDRTDSANREFATARVLCGPETVRRGLPRTRGDKGKKVIVLQVGQTGGVQIGDIVEVEGDGVAFPAIVQNIGNGMISVSTREKPPSGDVRLVMLSKFQADPHGWAETAAKIGMMFSLKHGDIQTSEGDSKDIPDNGTREGVRKSDGKIVAHRYSVDGGTGYARTAGSFTLAAKVVIAPPAAVGPGSGGKSTVAFPGKPPKNLAVGDLFVARHASDLHALRVAGVRTDDAGYYLDFQQTLEWPAEATEFHGPMRQILRPRNHDRGAHAAIDHGGIVLLTGLPEAAKALIKPGRKIIVEDERSQPLFAPVAASVLAASPLGNDLEVRLAPDSGAFAACPAGWTLFRANVVKATHGETAGARILGSGNGELPQQTFNLPVKDVSFVPFSGAESGVAADIDVTVDGVLWGYRDATDPDADGAEAYSTVLRDDGTLDIRFRRRLKTGTNNVVVTRHRTGGGRSGNDIPPYSFAKPARKHRYVAALVQPFTTAGGAEREAVANVRVNAPARVAANGRAVSLADFARLVRRHAGVWQARADFVGEAGRDAKVAITVVPAFGAVLTPSLREDLTGFVAARCLVNVRPVIVEFIRLPIAISATVRIDTGRYDKDTVRDAAEQALLNAFSLQRRQLGQAMYIAEILAALETVEGVATAVAQFDVTPAAAVPELRVPAAGGGSGLAALFPRRDQVAFVTAASAIRVVPEAAS